MASFLTTIGWIMLVSSCNSGSGSASLASAIKSAEDSLKMSGSSGISATKAQAAIKAYTNYADANPKDAATPNYLFKAGELYGMLQDNEKSIETFKRIYEQYPDYEKAPQSLFMMAFTTDEKLKNADAAKVLYQEFINKYPKHEMADDAQFAIDNMGKSPEDIVKMFEEKNKEQQPTEANVNQGNSTGNNTTPTPPQK